MKTAEGRKLFQLARVRIRDSEWEEIVFPKPPSPEDKQREKLFNKLGDFYQERVGQLEVFSNMFINEPWESYTIKEKNNGI